MAAADVLGISSLLGRLREAQRGLNDWASMQTSALDGQIAAQKSDLRSFESSALELAKQEAGARNESDIMKLQLQSETAELASLEESLRPLEAKSAILPPRLAELARARDEESARISEARMDVAEAERSRRSKLDALHADREFYEARMGLKFERQGDSRLQIVFHSIYPDRPDTTCHFTMLLRDDNLYQVEECSPMLDDVRQLVRDLNKTNNFAEFVRRMRARFASRN
eukprot:tig00020684_g12883.t1